MVSLAPEFPLIPDRQLHSQSREQRRFASAPAQSGSNTKNPHGIRHLEIIGGLAPGGITCITSNPTNHSIERDQIAGIEQVVQAGVHLPAKSIEGFLGQEFAFLDFVEAIGIPAAAHSD